MYSEATAAHPYSQVAILELGGHETGFLLGYIPSQVSNTAVTKHVGTRRQSVALFWLTTNPAPARVVHPPAWHREIAASLYAHNGLDRSLAALSEVPELVGPTYLTITEHADHNEATVAIDRIGADVVDVLGSTLAEQASAGRDLVHVDVSLGDPATAALPLALHDRLGVFFGGIVPEARGGDVLRLQWLNHVETDPSDVAVASDFGAELLAYVFERRRSGASAT
jgi:hypothetical protein